MINKNKIVRFEDENRVFLGVKNKNGALSYEVYRKINGEIKLTSNISQDEFFKNWFRG